ncbi:MAG TPA: hypothetical protein VF242_03680 [Nitrososphaeraceae archaeon]
MVCKGICSRHKAMRPKTGNRYLIGQKRCQVCQLFIDWQGLYCPCCGYKLRIKPRSSKSKLIIMSNTIIIKN